MLHAYLCVLSDTTAIFDATNYIFRNGNIRALCYYQYTVSSTAVYTYSQVGKADYEKERQAPKGMEWRTWEGQKLPQKDDDDN